MQTQRRKLCKNRDRLQDLNHSQNGKNRNKIQKNNEKSGRKQEKTEQLVEMTKIWITNKRNFVQRDNVAVLNGKVAKNY